MVYEICFRITSYYIIISNFVLLQMTFDYQYIDPGPDDPGCTKNRYLALNVSSALLTLRICDAVADNNCVLSVDAGIVTVLPSQKRPEK
jgi:hypothetical protein